MNFVNLTTLVGGIVLIYAGIKNVMPKDLIMGALNDKMPERGETLEDTFIRRYRRQPTNMAESSDPPTSVGGGYRQLSV